MTSPSPALAQQGCEIWQEQVNDAGGLLGRDVEMVIKDDQSDQNLVVTDYNALIQNDEVDLLLGTFSSLLNLLASAVAERNEMVYVEPAGGSPEMFSGASSTCSSHSRRRRRTRPKPVRGVGLEPPGTRSRRRRRT